MNSISGSYESYLFKYRYRSLRSSMLMPTPRSEVNIWYKLLNFISLLPLKAEEKLILLKISSMSGIDFLFALFDAFMANGWRLFCWGFIAGEAALALLPVPGRGGFGLFASSLSPGDFGKNWMIDSSAWAPPLGVPLPAIPEREFPLSWFLLYSSADSL